MTSQSQTYSIYKEHILSIEKTFYLSMTSESQSGEPGGEDKDESCARAPLSLRRV
jgi:hypothetical protein